MFRWRGQRATPAARSDLSTLSATSPEPTRSSPRSVGSTLVLPTTALLQQLLDEFGLTHGIDDDGDLVVRWEKYSVYFFSYGAQGEVLQARAYLNRRFPVETRTALIVMLDDWNRTKLSPKAYSVLPDDGMVGICAEQCQDFELGATRAQLKYAVGSWIDSLLRFVEWVDEQV